MNQVLRPLLCLATLTLALTRSSSFCELLALQVAVHLLCKKVSPDFNYLLLSPFSVDLSLKEGTVARQALVLLTARFVVGEMDLMSVLWWGSLGWTAWRWM